MLGPAMTNVQNWTRWILLGSDDSWGATLATGRLAITALAIFALSMHALDLATGLHMMLVHGIGVEQNPLARLIMRTGGPFELVGVKFGVVLAAVVVFVRTAELGRPRLARNCLLIAACLGMLGFASNLVG